MLAVTLRRRSRRQLRVARGLITAQPKPAEPSKVISSGSESVNMERVDEYLRRAAQSQLNADGTLDKMLKRQLLDIAQQWRELARQAKALAEHEARLGANNPSESAP